MDFYVGNVPITGLISDARQLFREFGAICVIAVMIFLVGMIIGATALGAFAENSGEPLVPYPDKQSDMAIGASLLRALMSGALMFAALALCGIWLPGIAVSIAAVFIHGFLIGAASYAVLIPLGFKGVAVLLSCVLLPEALVAIPSFCAASAGAAQWMQNLKYKLKTGRAQVDGEYMKRVLTYAVYALPAVVFRGAVAPVIMRWICSI